MAGHPPKYKTPEELEKAIEKYFAKIKEKNDIPLIEELAYDLGFSSRQSLYDMCHRKDKTDQFSYIINRAKLKCGQILNKMAMKGEVKERTACLNLSANYGLVEKKEVEAKVTTNISDEDLDEKIKSLTEN